MFPSPIISGEAPLARSLMGWLWTAELPLGSTQISGFTGMYNQILRLYSLLLDILAINYLQVRQGPEIWAAHR